MAVEEPKKLSEIVLNPDVLPESLKEKFAGKSVADVMTSYEEAQKLAHESREALKLKEQEIEALKTAPPIDDPDDDDDPEPDDTTYNDLFGDDTYMTKDLVDKRISALEKKYEKRLQEVEMTATDRALAQMEKRQFIDSHPEIFKGKTPQEADAVIKRIAGAGFVSGKQSLEGGLEAIREMADELGVVKTTENPRDVPADLPSIMGEYDSPESEVEHFKKVHRESRGNISSFLK